MKYLLNEHLNVLRIANIQNEEREYEEFLQSLYEINLGLLSTLFAMATLALRVVIPAT